MSEYTLFSLGKRSCLGLHLGDYVNSERSSLTHSFLVSSIPVGKRVEKEKKHFWGLCNCFLNKWYEEESGGDE